MYLDCVLSIAVFEILAAVFISKIQFYAEFIELIGKIVLCDNNFVIINTNKILIFHGVFNNNSCFQTSLPHIYSEKNDERYYATSPEMRMTSVIRLHSNMTSISP